MWAPEVNEISTGRSVFLFLFYFIGAVRDHMSFHCWIDVISNARACWLDPVLYFAGSLFDRP